MSLTSVYKPGQGKYVRWGTAAAVVLIASFAIHWVITKIPGISGLHPGVKAGVATVLAIGGILLALWIINRPRQAEFMILTESEMRKVSWPNRQSVMGSTKVVIFLTLLFSALLFFVDIAFYAIFHYWMKVY